MNATMESLAAANHLSLERYYRRHARVYDATRWVYLFGRSGLLKLLEDGPAPAQVLEVGCGTGRNLARLARRFPRAGFTGVDLSGAMLRQAERRSRQATAQFHWVRAVYDQPLRPGRPFDLVLFSYSLSMMNPGWDTALRTAAGELTPGGRIAVVDFHQTRLGWFRRWMEQRQVRLDGHLLPALCRQFRPRLATREPVYHGAWEYFLFLGTNRAAAV